MKISDNQPIFWVRNNGWISQPYLMYRSVCLGCPLSSFLYKLVLEVLTICIRTCNYIKGIAVGNKEHTLGQYATLIP